MAKCLRSFPCISKTHAVKWADHSTAFRCISGMHASAGSRYETNCQSARWPGTPPEQTAGITGPDLEVTTPLPLKNPEMQLPLGALPRDWANSERHVPPRSLEAKTQQESYRIQRYTATSKLPPDAETSSNHPGHSGASCHLTPMRTTMHAPLFACCTAPRLGLLGHISSQLFLSDVGIAVRPGHACAVWCDQPRHVQ